MTQNRTVVFAADHAGYVLKNMLVDHAKTMGFTALDLGTDGPGSVDYPDYGQALAGVIERGEADTGVLICGSGIGISIAANRNPAVRAALCTSGLMARLARQHNDANVLALGERLTGIETAKDCLENFLETPFEGGRHQRRIDKMS